MADYLVADKVKRTANCTKVSSKNQVTLPVAALRAAHIEQGDELQVEVESDGRIVLARQVDPIARFVGSIPGLSVAADPERLRDEWERCG